MGSYSLRALTVVLFVLFGCGDGAPPGSAPCAPECRSGFVCVLGECVSACNPPCARTLRCAGSGGSALCVSDAPDAAGDAQSPDAGAALDAPPDVLSDLSPELPSDLGPGALSDVPSELPTDAPSEVLSDLPSEPAMDALGTDATGEDVLSVDRASVDTPGMDSLGTDAGLPPAEEARADVSREDSRPRDADATPPVHCGNPGEICCVDISCIPGAECIDGRCVAIARASAECDHPGVCPAGYACVGPQFCGERSCFACGISRGTVLFGSDCTGGAMCASAVCDRGRCSTACTIGSTGDSECASRASGWICVQRIYGVGRRDGSPEPVGYVTLGTCAQSCARNSDCTGGRACLPSANFLSDRINFICNLTTRTGTAGTPCERPEQCQSGLCIPGVLPMGAMGCTAPCTANMDCPAAAPVCERLQLITPGGVFQTIRGCLPAM